MVCLITYIVISYCLANPNLWSNLPTIGHFALLLSVSVALQVL